MQHLCEKIQFPCFQFRKVGLVYVKEKIWHPLIACFLSNISAKYYENPTMLSRVIAKNIGDASFETQYSIWVSSVVSRPSVCT